jgi:hypothetical protein
MPSYEKLLMQTMPMVAATNAIEPIRNGAADKGKDLLDFAIREIFAGNASVKGVIEKEDPATDRIVQDPSAPANVAIEKRPIWSWTHKAASPNTVSTVRCQISGMNFMPHGVCDQIRWGFEDEGSKGTLNDAIRLTKLDGKVLLLPLTAAHLAHKFVLHQGSILDDDRKSPFWKNVAEIDSSLLMAFVYDIEGDIKPMTLDQIKGLGDDFMPSDGKDSPGGISCAVGDECVSSIARHRAVVCISLTCCKQRADFEPGEVLGVGRIYPHIMVISNLGIKKIEGTVWVDRPVQTAHFPPPGTLTAQGVQDQIIRQEMNPDISSLFVADANTGFFSFLTLPFWPNTFDHYLPDAFDSIKNQTVHAVKSKAGARSADGLIDKDIVSGLSQDTIEKVKRQGEFDNLHLAPTMSLAGMVADNGMSIASLKGDRVAMAPFCIHDCLHTHWRWSVHATLKSLKGWDQNGNPYASEGAPMVPHNHDVKVWLRGKALLSYTGTVNPVSGKKNPVIPPGAWQVIYHHGSGYALQVTGTSKVNGARILVDKEDGDPGFTKGGVEQDPQTSFAVFYWRLRFQVDGKKLVERTNIIDMKGARNL